MALQNALVKEKPQTFGAYLLQHNVQTLIKNTLKNDTKIAKFLAAISAVVANNESLKKINNYHSIITAALLCDSLNLSPSPQLGQFYIVPYENSKTGLTDGQSQIGYKGYIQLAVRSGQYKDLDVLAVKEGEFIGIDEETGKPLVRFIADYNARLAAPTIGYFAYFELLNGFRKSLFWTHEQMEHHADQYSKAFSLAEKKRKVKGEWKTLVSYDRYKAGDYDKADEWLYSSFWYKDFDAMAFKTMLRQLISKWGIMSIDFQNAVEKDMAVIKDDMTPVYVDNAETAQIETAPKPAIEQKPEAAPIIEQPSIEQTADPFSNFD